jgi:serine/threonine protein kinase
VWSQSPNEMTGLCLGGTMDVTKRLPKFVARMPAAVSHYGEIGESTTERAMDFTPPDPRDLEKLLTPSYSVHSLLGRGGMGAVYLATQTALERLVAIKILPSSLGMDLSFATRFRREARLMAQLNHPNIVNVHDFGQMGEGLWYLVMEYVDGVNLECYLRRQTVGQRDKLRIIDSVCAALEFAHEHGVIHRDIKPLNILLSHGGQVKMADFGLGKRTAGNQTVATKSGLLLGSPYFAAPEQFDRDRLTDHRTDIYSLGALIYYVITGTVPCGTWELPSKIADVDTVFDGIVQRAMSSDPKNRHQSVREIRDLLRPVSPAMERRAPAAKPEAQTACATDDHPEDRAHETLVRLTSPLLPQETLLGLWALRAKARVTRHSDYYIALGTHLLNRGWYMWAHDVATEGHTMDPDNVKMRQTRARALTGVGAHEESAEVLSELVQTGMSDEETLSLLADSRRDQWRQAQSSPEKISSFRQAVEDYQEFHARNQDQKSGINAAVLTALAGLLGEAQKLSREVLSRANARAQSGTGQERPDVCLGAAYFILGEMEGAREHFSKAACGWHEARDWRRLDAARSEALALAASLNRSAGEIESWFPRPEVVVFAGHQFDSSDHAGPRFLYQTMSKVREAIAEWLDRRKAHIAFCSAATGVDLLFIEALLERGREIHIVLPFDELPRHGETVILNASPSDPDRLQAVLKQAASVTHAVRGGTPASPQLLSFAEHVLFGLAHHHARSIGATLAGLAMWDGTAPCGKPGAANSVTWRRRRCPVTQINPLKFYDAARKPTPRFPQHQGPVLADRTASPAQDDYRAFLFVDASNPDGPDQQRGADPLPLDLISRTMEGLSAPPLTSSVSDGGLCLVFSTMADAVRGARRLIAELASPPDSSLEADSCSQPLLTLHVGLREHDETSQKFNAPEVQLNRITRLESVPATGRIYASQSFAALAAATGLDEFHCRDLGAIPIKGSHSTERLFLLQNDLPCATAP